MPENEYSELEGLAEKNNVSMAWIDRKAVIEFLERQTENTLQFPFNFAEPVRGNRSGWAKRKSAITPHA